jgi:hypothetical protein
MKRRLKQKLIRRKKRLIKKRAQKKMFLQLCELLTDYRRGVHRIRENTWGTMPGSEMGDGPFEALGSLVIGQKGKGNRGQARGNLRPGQKHPGDYANGMECKSSERAFPNIEFRLRGTPINVHIRRIGERQLIRLDPDLAPHIARQIDRNFTRLHQAIQNDVNSIQAIYQHEDEQWYGLPILGKTQKGCLIQVSQNEVEKWDKDAKQYQRVAMQDYSSPNLEPGTYIIMESEIKMAENESFNFMMRMEDAHPNWTAKQKGKRMLDWFNAGGIVYVQNYLDKRSRVCIAVLLLNPSKNEMNEKIHEGGCEKCFHKKKPCRQTLNCRNSQNVWGQGWKRHPTLRGSKTINTRMWKNGTRELANDNWSFQKTGVELIALAAETPEGFELLHWAPKGGKNNRLSNPIIQHKLLNVPEENKCMPAQLGEFIIDYEDTAARQELAEEFFRDCILRFYRKWRPIAKYTQTAINPGFGKIGEHLTLLWFGLRGCRVSKGGDAYESDGSESEIKTATGRRGDCMGTLHSATRYSLYNGGNVSEIQALRRYLFVRIMDERELVGSIERCNFKVALLASTQETMRERCRQLHSYFSGDHSNSEEFEYMAQPFNENFGQLSEGNLLEFTRVAEFIEHPPEQHQIETNPIPVVVACACEICIQGIMRWEPSKDEFEGSHREWLNARVLVI